MSSNPCGCGSGHLEDNVAGPDPCGCGSTRQVAKRDVNVADRGGLGGPPAPFQAHIEPSKE